LLQTKEKHYHVLGLKIFRSILSVGDEFYHRNISKSDYFKLIIQCLVRNIKKDNLISSMIIEMIEFIRTENARTLIEHLVTKHGKLLQQEFNAYTDVYLKLKARYDQYYEDNNNNEASDLSNRNSGSSKVSNDLKRRLYEEDSADAYLEDDDEGDSSKVYPNVLSTLSSYSDEDEDDDLESAFLASSRKGEPLWKKQCSPGDIDVGNLVPVDVYQENRLRMESPTYSTGSPMLDLVEDSIVATVNIIKIIAFTIMRHRGGLIVLLGKDLENITDIWM